MYKSHNVCYVYVYLANCLKFGRVVPKISASNRVLCFDGGIHACRQVRGLGMVSE